MTNISITHTEGEKRIESLLGKLPASEFHCYAEPRIDSSFTTSRYPDFVILWRQKGLIALEVKDWQEIKGGNQRQVTIVTRQHEEVQKENPVMTARQYSFNIKNLFEKRRELLTYYDGQERLQFPCESLVVLPFIQKSTISALESVNIFPENTVLSWDDCLSVDTFQTALERMRWTFLIGEPISEVQMEVIQHTLHTVEVRVKRENALSSTESVDGEKRGDLTESQEQIIFSPLPRLESSFYTHLVRGVAGSGKTVVVTKRAELLAKLRPDLRILVMAFNLDLAKDLRKRITNKHIVVSAFYDICKTVLGDKYPQGDKYNDELSPLTIRSWVKQNQELFSGSSLTADFASQEITRRKDKLLHTDKQYSADLHERQVFLDESTIQDLCAIYELYKDHQDALKASGEEWADWEDVPELTRQALIKRHKLLRYYDVIMIDEAQDMAPSWMQVTKQLLKPGGYLLLCDDPVQSLWRSFNWKAKGITEQKVDTLALPLRTTGAIADLAQSLFDIAPEMHVDFDWDGYPFRTDHLMPGTLPVLRQFASEEVEQTTILKLVQDRIAGGTPGHQIAIFYPSVSQNKFWEIPLLKKLEVYTRNFNKIKGMEVERVFVTNLHYLFNDIQGNNGIALLNAIRKLFVATTRARIELHISFVGELPEKLAPFQSYAQVYSEDS